MATLLNPVGYLQEVCQKHGVAAFPKYMESGTSGPDHSRAFTCKCFYDGYDTIGIAQQKKKAKHEAAVAMVQLLQEKGYFERLDNSVSKFDSEVSQNVSLGVKSPISALQEFCQANKRDLPNYYETSTAGGFVSECSVDKMKTFGHGSTKKFAKVESATKMCLLVGIYCEEYPSNSELDEEERPFTEKNSVAALQELCHSDKKLPVPVYIDKGKLNNYFVFVCNVGDIVAEGKDTTKKGAKLLAANKVLGKLLLEQGLALNGATNQLKAKSSFVNKYDSAISQLPAHKLSNRVLPKMYDKPVLEEFFLSDSDDEKTEDLKPLVPKDKSTSPSVCSLSNDLASLMLDDSVVEVEPSAITAMKTELEIDASENYYEGCMVMEKHLSESGCEVDIPHHNFGGPELEESSRLKPSILANPVVEVKCSTTLTKNIECSLPHQHGANDDKTKIMPKCESEHQAPSEQPPEFE